MFDYTAIADRLRRVGWSDDSQQTVVVELFTAQPSHSPK